MNVAGVGVRAQATPPRLQPPVGADQLSLALSPLPTERTLAQPPLQQGGGVSWGPPLTERIWDRPPPQQSPAGGHRPPESGSVMNVASVGVRAQATPPRLQLPVGADQLSLALSPPPTERTLAQHPLQQGSEIQQTSSGENRKVPIKRPDEGGTTVACRRCPLLVNYFSVLLLDEQTTIRQYGVSVKQNVWIKGRMVKINVSRLEVRNITKKLFTEESNLSSATLSNTVFDGHRYIYSAVPLQPGFYPLKLSDGTAYTVDISFLQEFNLSKNVLEIPSTILHGVNLVIKEFASRSMISVGSRYFPRDFKTDDIHCGAEAFRGFHHTLKITSNGLAMCLDYAVLPMHKCMSVIDFLKENIKDFQVPSDVWGLKDKVTNVLKGLKVTVTHRSTTQKFSIVGLTEEMTENLTFYDKKESNEPVYLVSYFWDKYRTEIELKHIPCLEVKCKNSKRNNYLPMECAILAEGQRFRSDNLDRNAKSQLRKLSERPPIKRMETINEFMHSKDGPCGGEVVGNFKMDIVKKMTKVKGSVLAAPSLLIGKEKKVTFHHDKYQAKRQKEVAFSMDRCKWSLKDDSVVDGKELRRWALIDFSQPFYDESAKTFTRALMNRCREMGILMSNPLVLKKAEMEKLSSVDNVSKLLSDVIAESHVKAKGGLQLIFCVMTKQHPGYKKLKFVSETIIGVMTQCCLASNAYKEKWNDPFLTNMGLKINAKLGGINFKLSGQLPFFGTMDGVMFIGADISHPAPFDTESPSIAAAVATISLDKYIARVRPQLRRSETIADFGSICLELVNAYAKDKKTRPKKIVVFRDGVGDGQFDMVLNTELADLKRKFSEELYEPTITVVVAQKRHTTRFFLENERGGINSGNIPPGTVVDTEVVHPHLFDFYLCSHYGLFGTSKPTHYYVLWDENGFKSDQMQQLIYHLCFTFVRSTKPISLVPPVYYADIVAGRGRLFLEAMENKSYAESSEKRFYELHPDMEGFMFFV